MAEDDDLLQTFYLECEDLLEQMAEGLRALTPGACDSDTVNAVFRAVHSIKGGAGAFRLSAIVAFAHEFETLLDALRNDRVQLNEDMLRVILRAGDHLADLVAAAQTGNAAAAGPGTELIEELRALAPEQAAQQAPHATPEFVPLALDLGAIDAAPPPRIERRYRITFRPHDSLYASGNDPCLLLRELSQLGTTQVRLQIADLPGLNDLDIARNHLSWSVDLVTEADRQAIAQVFEFVELLCDLTIEEFKGPEDQTPTPEQDRPDAAPEKPRAETSGAPVPQPPAAPRPTIRVDLERVDKLMNVVGEMIIQQAMLAEAVDKAALANGADISNALDELRHLARDIQDSVMAIRAQPVKPLFQRMHRIVREAAEASGKTARLVTEGEMTEVDKTVVEKLTDPLTHMVRNAVDHGLETPDRRRAAGKPPEGVITLSAMHRSGRVVITIRDDGAGIDRDRVRQIAIDKGLIPPEAELSEAEIDNLLFLPGFSTASTVSNLSGRGVGMDVVKSAIAALGGRVGIASQPGRGTSFTISLPLTLAVLDGMVVEVAGQSLVFPLSTVLETVQPTADDLGSLGAGAQVLQVRERYLPIIDVGVVLGLRGDRVDPVGRVALLIESEDGDRAAFVVDAIRDQQQVVIKSLEQNYGHVPGIAAATVFGNGRVALIADAGDMIATARRQPQPHHVGEIEKEPVDECTG